MRGFRTIALAAATVGCLLAAACGGGDKPIGQGGDGSAAPHGGTLTIANVAGQTWPCTFNPFNPAVRDESVGFVYEPLVYVNTLKNGAATPMLASSYRWSGDKKSVTFTVRSGVRWSDGKPFSAADVVFTFDLMKKHPSLDLQSLWTGAGLQSVTASGSKVTMRFKAPAVPYFYNFAHQVGIVPKHVWSAGDAAAHPDIWGDEQPVGTGPFTVGSCTANNIEYLANKNYWQHGKPYLAKVEYPAYLDNNPANLDLQSGKAQWGGQYIPNVDTFYKNKSPDNHYWFPPVANVAIYPNLDPSHKVTSKLAVRQAIASALDRQQIAKIGEGGEQPAANQTGVVTPTFDKYFDRAALQASGYAKPDPAKAKKLLQGLGYSTAEPLKLTVITVTGYTDWDASLAVVKQQLAKVGIDLTVQDLQGQSFDHRLFTGDYDLAYYAQSGYGPSPYYELRRLLYSKNTAPVGQQASSNYARYRNAAVDKAIEQYPGADAATQVTLVKQVEARMLADLPVIPTTESVDWFQYNTKNLTGWPTQADPYAQPAPYVVPDVEQVLLRVRPK